MMRNQTLRALAGLGVLVLTSFVIGVAPALADVGGPPSGYTEDSDTNDNNTPNNLSDDGDNKHPSGKDRSVENGGSGNQGNSGADPDDDANGPDRTNGGPDKANGSGGEDKADQDGNNGCGNDDDFEDDNEGWCGGKPKGDERIDAVRPCDSDPVMPGRQPCDEDEVDGEVIEVTCSDDYGTMPDSDPCENPVLSGDAPSPTLVVLGIAVEKGASDDDPVVADRAGMLPATDDGPVVADRAGMLPFTGGALIPFIVSGLVLVAIGLVAMRRSHAS